MATRAKFMCVSKTILQPYGSGEHLTQPMIVKLQPVYSSDPASENYAFWKATPNGTLEMQIDNPQATAMFEPGNLYFIDIAPAD
jgi:hypothetical protein